MTAQPAPKLTRPKYHVWLDPRPDLSDDSPDLPDDEAVYHHVTVNAGDQLRAELEAKRHALGSAKDSPMHLSVLWLWASLVRTHAYADTFHAFKTACIAWEPDDADADADDAAGDTVTPTEASTG